MYKDKNLTNVKI